MRITFLTLLATAAIYVVSGYAPSHRECIWYSNKILNRVDDKDGRSHPSSRSVVGSRISRGHICSNIFVTTSNSEQVISHSLPESSWMCLMSTNQDLDAAVAETIEGFDVFQGHDLAIFYVSSIYEASSFKYDTIFKQLKEKLPNIKVVLGSTTGTVIGPATPYGEPVELEGRAGFSLTLGKFDDDVDVSTFSLTKEEMVEYMRDDRKKVRVDQGNNKTPMMLFTTEQCKPYLSDFINELEKREGGEAFGAIASSVTSLHQPKVFVGGGDLEGEWSRFSSGMVGLVLSGNIAVKTLSARSCLPVGPVYEVREKEGKDILTLMPAGGTMNDRLSPLEALDNVIKTIPYDYSEALKRELLVGAVVDDLEEGEKVTDRIFFGQKPLTFDPISGSITLSSVPGGLTAEKLLFRFCIRDTVTSQNDLLSTMHKVKRILGQAPMACMLLGSMDRGNKIFKYMSWEASQLYSALEECKLSNIVPISGMFSTSSFGKMTVGEDGTPAAGRRATSITEADSVYAFLTKESGSRNNREEGIDSSFTDGSTNTAAASSSLNKRDYCSPFELAKFNDEEDLVIVEKRDPESAAPVRVATMDYVIPEKAPQPSNVLESMVWDREQAVDRMRERFQLSKALMQATRSEVKYPVRKLSDALKQQQSGNRYDEEEEGEQACTAEGTLSLIVEFNRASLRNGKILDGTMGDSDVSRLAAAKKQIEEFSEGIQKLTTDSTFQSDLIGKGLRIAAIGAHTDTGTFRGSYEDLETLRESESGKVFPVVANDCVLYAYQLFKAKSSGSDAIKLHAAILPAREISYMAKIAKKINLGVVVVVNSVPQVLNVLKNVPEVEILSISGRNMRLWKIAEGKGRKILQNEDVRSALALRRVARNTSGKAKTSLTVICEGVSTTEELLELREEPLVDGVFLAEEVLVRRKLPVAEALASFLLE